MCLFLKSHFSAMSCTFRPFFALFLFPCATMRTVHLSLFHKIMCHKLFLVVVVFFFFVLFFFRKPLSWKLSNICFLPCRAGKCEDELIIEMCEEMMSRVPHQVLEEGSQETRQVFEPTLGDLVHLAQGATNKVQGSKRCSSAKRHKGNFSQGVCIWTNGNKFLWGELFGRAGLNQQSGTHESHCRYHRGFHRRRHGSVGSTLISRLLERHHFFSNCKMH